MAESGGEASWYDNLDGFLDHAWKLVVRGAADRRSPFHVPTLVTLGIDGAPRARSVVLRKAAATSLRFHSDARAGKIAEVQAEPRVAVHFYAKEQKLQVRATGAASVHCGDDPIAREAWAETRSFSRTCYRVTPPAGSPITAGGAYDQPGGGDDGRDNFAVIECAIDGYEVLYLAAAGHRRARLRQGVPTWLVP